MTVAKSPTDEETGDWKPRESNYVSRRVAIECERNNIRAHQYKKGQNRVPSKDALKPLPIINRGGDILDFESFAHSQKSTAATCQAGCPLATCNSVINSKSSTLKFSFSSYTITVRPVGDIATKSRWSTPNARPSAIRIVKGRNGCWCSIARNCSVVMFQLYQILPTPTNTKAQLPPLYYNTATVHRSPRQSERSVKRCDRLSNLKRTAHHHHASPVEMADS
jgi:hypothetical protein